VSTSDDSFRAEGPGLFGFLTDSNDDNVPVKAFGTVGYAPNVGVLGFSGVAADPEGPIQQNSYSQRAGVEGGSVDFTGTAGVSLNHVGVYGQVEDSPPVPAGFRAGVLGAASTQPGIIGFSRDGDGIQGASFTSTAVRAVSFFGPGVQSISGARNGVTGISGTQGPTPVGNLPTTAGVFGSSDTQAGVIGTSRTTAGVLGFSNNVGVLGSSNNIGVFGVSTNLAGVFQGNLLVTGTKSAAVPFPDGSRRALYCMESPDLWFEDFGTAKLKRGRAVVRLDADFAKVIKRGYHVFLTPEVIAAASSCTARVPRASRCANSWAASRASPFPTASLDGARTLRGTAASRRSTRSCPSRRQRVRREHASRPRRRCAHSSPGSSGRPASVRRSARGNSEDRALHSAGRTARPGVRRSNSAKAITLVSGAAAAWPLAARAQADRSEIPSDAMAILRVSLAVMPLQIVFFAQHLAVYQPSGRNEKNQADPIREYQKLANEDHHKRDIDGIAAEGKDAVNDELVGMIGVDADAEALSEENQAP
jgi:hypothetical protein